MPIREFRCEKCGARFETLVLPSEKESDLECPECHAKNLKRVMSVFCGRVPNGGTGAANGGCSTCSGGSCSTCGH